MPIIIRTLLTEFFAIGQYKFGDLSSSVPIYCSTTQSCFGKLLKGSAHLVRI